LHGTPGQSIDIKAVAYWRCSAIIKSIFLLLIPAAYYWAVCLWQWPLWIIIILLTLILAYAIFFIFFKPHITWRTWRYNVSEYEIDLVRGVFIKKHTIIPMVRVQHVDTEQGPLLRYYGLSTVSVSTAAGTQKIPALADEVAADLRNRISELARVVEEDV
jgi:membrane protein YdbS with pleckstrin-like domain